MKFFKEIFELDPNEVEAFIKTEFKMKWTRSNCPFPSDMDIKIYWYVTCNEFYVHLEPKLITKNYKTFKFRGKKVSLNDYFNYRFLSHSHFTFEEIYGQMTGKTTFVHEIHLVGEKEDCDIKKMISVIYDKKWMTLILVGNQWLEQDFEEEGEEMVEIRRPLPEHFHCFNYDLDSYIKKED